MSRPARVQILQGTENWDAPLSVNFDNIFTNPYPVPLVAADLTGLNAAHDPTEHVGCLAAVGDPDGSASLYFSNGTTWTLVV